LALPVVVVLQPWAVRKLVLQLLALQVVLV
jgi:hypothetical protein